MPLNARLPLLFIALGLALMTFGMLDDGHLDADDVRTLGATVVLLSGGFTIFWRLSRPTNAAYELGRMDGVSEGYEAGRRARPVLVPFPRQPDIQVKEKRRNGSDDEYTLSMMPPDCGPKSR